MVLTSATKSEIYGAKEYRDTTVTIIVNETLSDQKITQPGPDVEWVTIFTAGSNIRTISIKFDDTYVEAFNGLRLDGKLMVDINPGEDKLVTETPYDTKLTVDGSTDLADMTGSVLMTDGSTEASGAYTQTPYKLTTTDIESVGTGVPTKYDLRVDNRGAPTNNTDVLSWADVSSREILDITFGSAPGTQINGSGFYYKFDTACVPSFNRAAGQFNDSVTRLYGSPDGVNWTLEGEFNDIAGPGDTTISGSNAYIYWAWIFSANAGGNSFDCTKYYPTETITAITLTFPGAVSTNPDLQYFRAGDIVQGRQLTGKVQWTDQYEASWDSPGVNEQSPYTVGERFTPKTANSADSNHYWTMIRLDSPIMQGIKYDLNKNGYWVGNALQFKLFASNDGVTWIDKGTSSLPATIGAGESWQYFATHANQGDSTINESDDYFYSWFFDPGEEHKSHQHGLPQQQHDGC